MCRRHVVHSHKWCQEATFFLGKVHASQFLTLVRGMKRRVGGFTPSSGSLGADGAEVRGGAVIIVGSTSCYLSKGPGCRSVCKGGVVAFFGVQVWWV